jgi:hypothetical protein
VRVIDIPSILILIICFGLNNSETDGAFLHVNKVGSAAGQRVQSVDFGADLLSVLVGFNL